MKKSKRSIICVLVMCMLFVLLACSSQSYNRSEIEKEFPESTIVSLRGSAVDFIVRDNKNNIWYIKTFPSASGNGVERSFDVRELLIKGN